MSDRTVDDVLLDLRDALDRIAADLCNFIEALDCDDAQALAEQESLRTELDVRWQRWVTDYAAVMRDLPDAERLSPRGWQTAGEIRDTISLSVWLWRFDLTRTLVGVGFRHWGLQN
jgi:hypothetical protein